jgi:hypothetical protein
LIPPDNAISCASLLLLKATVFGDRFLAASFRRLAHNTYVDSYLADEEIAFSVGYKEVIWAFENIAEDNPILAFMIHLQCAVWEACSDSKKEKELRSQLPHKFLLDVMLKHNELIKEQGIPGGVVDAADICVYRI